MPQPKDDNADGNLDFDINGKRVTVKRDNLEDIVDVLNQPFVERLPIMILTF